MLIMHLCSKDGTCENKAEIYSFHVDLKMNVAKLRVRYCIHSIVSDGIWELAFALCPLVYFVK